MSDPREKTGIFHSIHSQLAPHDLRQKQAAMSRTFAGYVVQPGLIGVRKKTFTYPPNREVMKERMGKRQPFVSDPDLGEASFLHAETHQVKPRIRFPITDEMKAAHKAKELASPEFQAFLENKQDPAFQKFLKNREKFKGGKKSHKKSHKNGGKKSHKKRSHKKRSHRRRH